MNRVPPSDSGRPPAPRAAWAREALLRRAPALGLLSPHQLAELRRRCSVQRARGQPVDPLNLLPDLVSPGQLAQLRRLYHQLASSPPSGSGRLPAASSGRLPARAAAAETIDAPIQAAPPRRQAAPSGRPPAKAPAAETIDAATAPRRPQRAQPSPTKPGSQAIGPYRIDGELARGGMGVVYRGWHPGLERVVAIKVLLAGARASAGQVERFRIEARAAGRLRHANIVAVHDVGEVDGQPFIVMDLIEGCSLADLMEEARPEPRDSARITRDLADALYHAHTHSILHRDVKPANVLVTPEGLPLLTDFGLAKEIDRGHELTGAGKMLGTPSYMPPEQARGELERIDRRSDVYSLGATLYEMLTGQPPVTGSSVVEVLTSVLRGKPAPASELREGLDPDLNTLCMRCLEKDPADRYASAAALRDDLTRYLEDRPILARPPTLRDRARRWARHNRAAAVLGAAVLALLPALGLAAALGVARIRAQGAVRAAQAREAELGLAERKLVEAVSQESAKAAQRLRDLDASASTDSRIGRGLASLQEASRWRALAPDDEAAARALFEAALALGREALAGEQWGLARAAFAEAQGLGVDEARAEADIASVHSARTAEAARREAEILSILSDARRGSLRERPDGLREAMYRLARYREAQTASLLVASLRDVTRHMIEIASPQAEEGTKAPGGAPRSRESTPLRRSAKLQRQRLGQGALDEAKLACLTLGHLGLREGAVEALGEYLEVEADPSRALTAGLALCRLDGADAQRYVLQSLIRFTDEERYLKPIRRRLEAVAADVALPEESAQGYFQRGNWRYTKGDAKGAVEDLDRSLERDPSRYLAWCTRGLAKRALGDLPGAISDFSRAIELNPERGLARNNRGLSRFESRDLAGAEADFRRCVEVDPSHAPAWTNLGVLLLERGDLEGAVEQFSRAVELDPDQTLAWHNRAVARDRLGDLRGAESDASRAIALDPGQACHWAMRGVVRAALGDSDAALADLTRAVELGPREAEPLRQRAAVLRERGDREGAKRDLDRAIELDPSCFEAWNDRGAERLRLGDLKGGLRDLSRAIALRPDDFMAWVNRALARQRLGDLPGAEADLLEALRRDPNRPDTWRNLAALRRKRGDPAGALKANEKAVEVAPTDAGAWTALGITRKARDPRAGILAFDRATKLDPTYAPAYLYRGNAHLALRDYDAAQADLTRAAKLDPSLFKAWTGLAKIHEAQSDPDNADRAYSKAIEVAPRSPWPWFERGLLRARRRDFNRGIADLTRALELDPAFAQVLVVRAVARREAGDKPGAVADYERYLKLEPNGRNAAVAKQALRELRGDER